MTNSEIQPPTSPDTSRGVIVALGVGASILGLAAAGILAADSTSVTVTHPIVSPTLATTPLKDAP